MENEKRLVEIMAELLIKFDELLEGQKITNNRLGHLESEMIKLNLQTTENTRAIFKLAEKVEQIGDLHNRVTKLEKVVYK